MQINRAQGSGSKIASVHANESTPALSALEARTQLTEPQASLSSRASAAKKANSLRERFFSCASPATKSEPVEKMNVEQAQAFIQDAYAARDIQNLKNSIDRFDINQRLPDGHTLLTKALTDLCERFGTPVAFMQSQNWSQLREILIDLRWYKGSYDMTAIRAGASIEIKKDCEFIRQLFKFDDLDPNASNDAGNTPLMIIASNLCPQAIAKLLTKHAKLDQGITHPENGYAALHMGVLNNNSNFLKLVSSRRDFNPGLSTDDGSTILHLLPAAQDLMFDLNQPMQPLLTIIKNWLKLKNRPDANKLSNDGVTALYKSIADGNQTVSLWMLEDRSIRPAVVMNGGATVLLLACHRHYDNREVIQSLLTREDIDLNGLAPLCLWLTTACETEENAALADMLANGLAKRYPRLQYQSDSEYLSQTLRAIAEDMPPVGEHNRYQNASTNSLVSCGLKSAERAAEIIPDDTKKDSTHHLTLALEQILNYGDPNDIGASSLKECANLLLLRAPENLEMFMLNGVPISRDGIEELEDQHGYHGLRAALQLSTEPAERRSVSENVHRGGFLMQGAFLHKRIKQRITDLEHKDPEQTHTQLNALIDADNSNALNGLERIHQNKFDKNELTSSPFRLAPSQVLADIWSYIQHRSNRPLQSQLTTSLIDCLHDIGQRKTLGVTECNTLIINSLIGIDHSLTGETPDAQRLTRDITTWGKTISEQFKNSYSWANMLPAETGPDDREQNFHRLKNEVIRTAVLTQYVERNGWPQDQVQTELDRLMAEGIFE